MTKACLIGARPFLCVQYCVEMSVSVQPTEKDVDFEPITNMIVCDVTMQE